MLSEYKCKICGEKGMCRWKKTFFTMAFWQKYKNCNLCPIWIPKSKCNMEFKIMLFFPRDFWGSRSTLRHLSDVVVNLMKHVISFESGTTPINKTIDDTFTCGKVCTPIKLETIIDLLRVWSTINIDHKWISFALTKIWWQIQSNLQ